MADERQRRKGESPLEYQKRLYRPLVSLDAVCGFERDETGIVVRWYPSQAGTRNG
jgi:hypothetical protein